MSCEGCGKRRAQLKKAKERILSLFPGYKGIADLTLIEAKRLSVQAGDAITSDEMNIWGDSEGKMYTWPLYNPDNPYNLTVMELVDIKAGILVYHEQADQTSIKYLGDEYRLDFIRYQDTVCKEHELYVKKLSGGMPAYPPKA